MIIDKIDNINLHKTHRTHRIHLIHPHKQYPKALISIGNAAIIVFMTTGKYLIRDNIDDLQR